MAGDLLPYFKVYPAETLADERFDSWGFAERGLWLTLLFKNWVNGSIPEDPEEIARLLHADATALRPLWDRIADRFIPHPDFPGRLTSRRLEMEREEAQAKSRAGQKAALSRWSKPVPDATALRPQSDRSADAMQGAVRPPMPAEQSNAEQSNAAHSARTARVGAGHPAFEAIEHWTGKVWPSLSSATCPEVEGRQAQSLAGLCARHGPAEVKAAMDRAAADPFWKDKLDLDTFITKFPRFLLHDASKAAGPKPRKVVGGDFTTPPVFEGEL